jgi:predicted NUDIX family phosphoesterase
MKSKLSTDILNKHERSLFKRIATGKFGLREWDEDEYRAQRFKKSLLDEDIIVFNRSHLSKIVKSNGITPVDVTKLEQLLKTICSAEKRSIAEQNDHLVQLVSAFIVKRNDRYLTYKRTKRLPESKLHGYYSIMFGGHITESEFLPLLRIFDPKMKSPFVTRELFEELIVNSISALEFRGVLYDDSVPVSRLHLGIVYDVSIGNANYSIGERGFLMDPRIEDLGSIVSRIDDFENWSRIIIEEEMRNANYRLIG